MGWTSGSNSQLWLWGLPSLLSNGYKGGSFPHGVGHPDHEADHSPPSSTKVKNAWSYTSAPPIHFHGVVLK
jgi:hypothetical protein